MMVTHDPRLAAQAPRTIRLGAGRVVEDSARSSGAAAALRDGTDRRLAS
jgi:hypothetical protein